MYLDLLILGTLRGGPMHGYELKRRVQRPGLTALSNNSIYPALARFVEAGLVTKSVETIEGRPPRNIVSITDAGRRVFSEMLAVLPPDLAANEQEFLVRVAYFHELTVNQRRGILMAREHVVTRQIEQLQQLLPAPVADESALDEPTLWRAASMSHLIDQWNREREWLRTLAEIALEPEETQVTTAEIGARVGV